MNLTIHSQLRKSKLRFPGPFCEVFVLRRISHFASSINSIGIMVLCSKHVSCRKIEVVAMVMFFEMVLLFPFKIQEKSSQYKIELSCTFQVVRIMGKIIGSMSSFSPSIPEEKAEENNFSFLLVCCSLNSEARMSYTNHFTCCIWTSMKPPTCWVVSSWLEVKGQIYPFGVLPWLTHTFALHLHLME